MHAINPNNARTSAKLSVSFLVRAYTMPLSPSGKFPRIQAEMSATSSLAPAGFCFTCRGQQVRAKYKRLHRVWGGQAQQVEALGDATGDGLGTGQLAPRRLIPSPNTPHLPTHPAPPTHLVKQVWAVD